jgi:ATP-dependent protease ClpP protease subunit
MAKWYKITAKKNKAKILIYDQIGENWFGEGVNAKKFINELDALNVPTIDLHINSPGGSVFGGTAIYNALKSHKAKINVKIDGIAASIASVVAMAGNTVEMPENALLMIHDPSALVQGTAEDMRKMIDALDKIKSGMIGAYQTRADLSIHRISEMMTDETWFTAQEAAELGFADKTTEPVEIAANFQALSNFKNMPEISFSTNKPNLQEDSEMEITFDLIKNDYPEIFAEILKTVDIDYIRENIPEAVTAFKAEGMIEGAENERSRIKNVQAQSMPGHEKLFGDLMFDGKTTGEQAAVKILQAEKEARANMVTDNETDAPNPIQQPSTDSDVTGNYDHLPVDKRCEARWEKDISLQKEFGGVFDAYLAYEKAIEAERVKVLN